MMINAGGFGYYDVVADWRKPQRVVPTLALMMTNGLVELQKGKQFNQQLAYAPLIYVISFWPSDLMNLYDNRVPKDGLHEPLTDADFERATDKPAAELAKICRQREAAD